MKQDSSKDHNESPKRSVDLGQPILLTEYETAKLLQVSVQLLRKWRSKGAGPEHVKLGKCVRYSRNDVVTFIALLKASHSRA
jgi:predicted DNA-binding transcriptional regulator AlpA